MNRRSSRRPRLSANITAARERSESASTAGLRLRRLVRVIVDCIPGREKHSTRSTRHNQLSKQTEERERGGRSCAQALAPRREMLHATMTLAAVLAAASKNTRPSASNSCGDMVECEGNTTISSVPTCPGHPTECSGHGLCRAAEGSGHVHCHCSSGYFGNDCGRRVRECTKLRSCSDCQDPANAKFCGWCADARYCLPKHVHKGLVRKSKGCTAWYDDTCPAPRSNKSAGSDSSNTLFEEWADDSSVALAEALVMLIDGEMGEGASSWLGFFLLLGGVSLVILCTLREKRAEERRKRYEAFMTEEAESLRGNLNAYSPWAGGRTPQHGRQLGPSWAEAHAEEETSNATPRASALADAISGSAMSGLASTPTRVSAGMAGTRMVSSAERELAAAREAAAQEAAAREAARKEEAQSEALRRSVRDAAYRDITERKEMRRRLAEETRESAIQVERAAAEESARAELAQAVKNSQAKARVLPERETPPAAPPPAATVLHVATPAAATPPVVAAPAITPATAVAASTPSPNVPAVPAPAVAVVSPPPVAEQPAVTPTSAPPAKLAAAEAEFLAALDDL